jgi:hypothetical protein
MSDNGGRLSKPGQPEAELPRNHPLRNGKGSMYEGDLRVPFIVIGPGVTPGSVSKIPVTGLDIMPTIADLAGYEEALPDSLDGGSMANILFNRGAGDVRRKRPFLFFHHAIQWEPQTALETWKNSGMSVSKFCKAEGLSEGTFYGWQRRLFGKKSEKLDPAQGLLFENLYDQVKAKIDQQKPSKSQSVKKRKRADHHGRNPLPKDLPRSDERSICLPAVKPAPGEPPLFTALWPVVN